MRTAIPSDSSAEARLLVRVTMLAKRFAQRLLGPDDAEDLAQRVVARRDESLTLLVMIRADSWRFVPPCW
jgi:DNA-directed RNA polymerase specialized sigma24 family protein